MEFSQGDIVAFKLWNGKQTDLEIELVENLADESECWKVRVVNKHLDEGRYEEITLTEFDLETNTFICCEDLFGKPVSKGEVASIDVMDYL